MGASFCLNQVRIVRKTGHLSEIKRLGPRENECRNYCLNSVCYCLAKEDI